MANQGGWIAKDSKDNATATATKAAVSGKQHVVHGVDASFSVTPAAPCLLQVLDGASVVWEGYASSPVSIPFGAGISITVGNATSAVLAASGTAGRIGKVNLHGRTKG